MNRKDTIIIAVLINAGLLAILFMLAINSDDEVLAPPLTIPSAFVDNQTAVVPVSSAPSPSHSAPSTFSSTKTIAEASGADEMDRFLKNLSTQDLSQSAFVDDEGGLDIDQELAGQVLPIERAEESKETSDMNLVEVVVKRGDALEKLARNNGTTVETIKKINNLNSSKLSIGQVLRIPVKGSAVATARTQPTVKSPASSSPHVSKTAETKAPGGVDPQYYTIKSGDNPWKIAKQHQVKYDDILKLNGIDEEKARNLKVGDKIRVK